MSKTKYTAGPWEMYNNGFIIAHSRSERKAIGQFTGCYSEQKHADEHPYNNKLIAAAPELLEALNKVNKLFYVTGLALGSELYFEIRTILCDAIKKVEE